MHCLLIALDFHMFRHNGYGPGTKVAQGPKSWIPEDYTKAQQTLQSPETLHKAPTDYTKPQEDYTKTPKRLYEDLKY